MKFQDEHEVINWLTKANIEFHKEIGKMKEEEKNDFKRIQKEIINRNEYDEEN